MQFRDILPKAGGSVKFQRPTGPKGRPWLRKPYGHPGWARYHSMVCRKPSRKLVRHSITQPFLHAGGVQTFMHLAVRFRMVPNDFSAVTGQFRHDLRQLFDAGCVTGRKINDLAVVIFLRRQHNGFAHVCRHKRNRASAVRCPRPRLPAGSWIWPRQIYESMPE